MSYQSTLVTHGCGIELELVVGLMVVFVTLTLTQVYHFISCKSKYLLIPCLNVKKILKEK